MSKQCSVHCPLCMEEMDPTDQHLKPCKCGYEICVWCWNHIIQIAEKNETEGRCPACRVPYEKDRILRITINTESLTKHDSQKKLPKTKPKSQELSEDLNTLRVIQRNLVYVSGVPYTLADEMTLRRKEFFGQYGKIARVVVVPPAEAFLNSRVVYITFCKQEDALRCIEVVDGYILNESPLKACFGTTRYCHTWLKNRRCSKPDCQYVHDVCSQEDICTKDEVASACIRKVQKSSCVSKILLPRSGSILPPPVDSQSKNSGGKVTLQSLANEHYFNGRKHAEKGDELSSLPPTASWASTPLAGRLSYASVAVPQGPIDRSHMPFSFVGKATDSEVRTPSHFQNVNQICEEQSTGKKFTTDTNGLVRTSDTFVGKLATELEENIGLLNFRALDQEIIAFESDAYASPCDSYTEKVQKVRATQVGTNLDRSKRELSVASANDIISYSRMGKAKMNTSDAFCSSFNQSNQGIDCFDGVSVGSSSPSGYSVHGSLLKGVSATQAYSPYHDRSSGSSNEIRINSLNRINNSAACMDNSYSLSTFDTRSSDILGCPFSYSTYPADDLQKGVRDNENFELQSLDYRSHRSIFEKNITDTYIGDSRVNRIPDEADKCWKENDTLSDFLSLDLSRVSHLIGDPLLAGHFPNIRSNHLIGDSEFASARVDDSNCSTTTPWISECNASNVGKFGQLYNADKGAIYAHTCVDNALKVSHLNEHQSLTGQHSLFTTKSENKSKSHFSSSQSAYTSKLAAGQLPAIPVLSRSIPPPGFHTQSANNSSIVLSRSIPPPGFHTQGSRLKSNFHGYSDASFHREINRENSYNHIATDDCAATEFSIRGMPQSSQLVSPNCDSSSVDPAKRNNMLPNSTNLAENPVIVNERGTSIVEKNNTYWENRLATFDVPPGSRSSESCNQETEVTKRSLSGILHRLLPGSKFGHLK